MRLIINREVTGSFPGTSIRAQLREENWVASWLKENANLKQNTWLTAPKEVTPVNYTSVSDWQMAVRWDNVISITLRQV